MPEEIGARTLRSLQHDRRPRDHRGVGRPTRTLPLRPTNVYEATKAEAELAVRDAWRDGFPAVIARPGFVYGPGDLHLLGFFRSILRRQFRPIGRREIWLHPIYIDDLTDGLILCGRAPRRASASAFIWPVSGLWRSPSWRRQSREPEAPAAAGTHPTPAARAVAMVGDLLPDRVRQVAPLTRNRLDFLTHERVYDVSKARRVLEFSATTDLPTGAARSVAWYRHQGHLPEQPGFSSRVALSRR